MDIISVKTDQRILNGTAYYYVRNIDSMSMKPIEILWNHCAGIPCSQVRTEIENNDLIIGIER